MASTVFDIPAATAVLKELYAGQTLPNLTYKDNPFLAMVPKMTDFVGKNYPMPLQYTVSQGRSATFANAQANISAPALVEFLLTRSKDYSLAQIDNETMLASASDLGSFARGAKVHVDSAVRSLKLSLASGIFRTGTGSIGAITTITTGVIVLTNPGDVVQFETNMKINAAATDGGAPRASSGWIIAVNRNTGTITVATALGGPAATPAAWAAGDFLIQDGDSNAKMKGLAAWIPQVDPTATPFFGVDRTPDRVRLAGIFYDGSAQSIEEAQISATTQVGREGGTTSVGMMGFTSFAALEMALGTKVQYADYKGPADIGFRGIRVNGANSIIDIFPDRNCQPLTEWLLQMDTWKFASLGPSPQILTYEDGVTMLRVTNADAAELRVGSYHQLGCNAPGWNAQVRLAA